MGLLVVAIVKTTADLLFIFYVKLPYHIEVHNPLYQTGGPPWLMQYQVSLDHLLPEFLQQQ